MTSPDSPSPQDQTRPPVHHPAPPDREDSGSDHHMRVLGKMVGTAKAVKLVNNMMSMGNVLIAAEAFAMGTAAGVDPQKLFEVLSEAGGRSFHFQKRFPNVLKGDYPLD